MKFWDTSALVPLLVDEPSTTAVQAAYREDPTVIVAWTTAIECASAVARAEHDGIVDASQAGIALARLDELLRVWREVEPTADLRDVARRLLRVHRLRAADAVQLAAAMLASQHRPASLTIVTLDHRLEAAAHREGFVVDSPGSERPDPDRT
ncbi:MAG: type II toxin-antitoxin system VapC family toxin [Acidobacteriota bacterium]